MAKLFPERLPASAEESERRVMAALADGLDDDFVVFHSVGWHAHSRKPDGEADFLVGHPELGFLVLEVKGGGINFDASTGSWTSVDRSGVTHPIKNPFEQALHAKHEIVRELRSDQRWPPGRRVQMGYLVVFPDMVVTQSGFTSRGPREIVIGKNDLGSIGDAIVERLHHWRMADPAEAPGPAGVSAAIERFGRSWSYRIPLRDAIEPEEQRIIELTEQQMDVLTTLGRHRKAAIGGCAGSGKSLMAIAKAQELARAGRRVLLTCFNKALAQHWSSTLDLGEGVVVRHFHGFCSDLVRESGIQIPQGLRDQEFWDWLPTGLLEAIAADSHSFDAVIVDEGQDFESHWLEALDLLLEGEGTFYVFFDDNQRLYRTDRLPGWLGEPYQLNRNVRNTNDIGELVRRYYSGPMRLSGIAGRPVQCQIQPLDADGVPGTVAGLRRALAALRHERAEPSDIVVLTGYRFDRLLDNPRMGPWTLRTRDQADGDVLVETIHSFKGQDSPIVVLADLRDLPERAEAGDRAAEALLYVGLSRARSVLVVVATEPSIALLQRRLVTTLR
jgi:hypothetical protein